MVQTYESNNCKLVTYKGRVIDHVLKHMIIRLFQYFALSEVPSTMGHGDLGRLHFRIPF